MNKNGNTDKTHCKRDHEFTPENTHINSKGSRVCRSCKRIRDNARYLTKYGKSRVTYGQNRPKPCMGKFSCGLTKAPYCFYLGKGRLQSLCKTCHNKRSAACRRLKRKDIAFRIKEREANRRRYKANPEKYKARHRQWYLRTKGKLSLLVA